MKPLLEWIDRHRQIIRGVTGALLPVALGGVYAIVYMTGGIRFVYSHSMYLPILLAGFVFGIKGGLLTGVLGGLVLGPWMPINVSTGEMQNLANWLYRAGFFTLVGFLSGAASDGARFYIDHLKWLSLHDSGSKLKNRNALFDELTRLAGRRNESGPFVLAAVALENTMELKSTFGVPVIEAAVQQLAVRYGEIVGEPTVYHTETAQLAIVIADSRQDVERLLDAMIAASQEPILFSGIPIHIDSRMGTVALTPEIPPAEVCLQKVEAALTVAQDVAQDRVAYNPEIMRGTQDNLIILGELKEAIKSGQLSLHYQPKIDIPTGTIHGVEALLRWQHPIRGNIPPGDFIRRAEQSTLIQTVTEFVMTEAVGQIAQWRKCGIDLRVAVNVSPRDLLRPGFSDFVIHVLEQFDVSPELLELEVTEGALMTDMNQTIAELIKLADLKIIISIDDFGTGYSSLQYLHKLPASLIKIDQSFVRRLHEDVYASSVLEAAVMLAHKLGIKAVAEGVETAAAYEHLGAIGCDVAQGFFICRPLPTSEFESWYATFRESAGHCCSGTGLQIG